MEMKRSTLIWIVIGVLFVVALYMIFKAGDTSVVQSTGSAAQVAARTAASSAPASSGMVGGC